MVRTTIGIGILLILTGLVAYIGSGQESVTALIPGIFGLVFVGIGWVGLKAARERKAMIGALALGVLGLLGSLSRPVSTLAGGEDFQLSLATGAQIVMAALCLVLCAVLGVGLARGRSGEQPPPRD